MRKIFSFPVASFSLVCSYYNKDFKKLASASLLTTTAYEIYLAGDEYCLQ